MNDPLTREILLENYQNPQNNSKPESYTHSGSHANRSCGDEITVYLQINGNKLERINYEASACALTIASASILSEELKGKTLLEISKMNLDTIEKLIGDKLSISRQKCAILPLEAIKNALALNKLD